MLKIFNTETKNLEEFRPLKEKTAKVYQCGPTVYWTQHIGNMRAVIVGDIVFRTLKYFDYQTTFIRNYTDVGHLSGDNLGNADTGEDRMNIASKREHTSPEKIAQKYITQYEKDTQKLNTLSPSKAPRATAYISEIRKMVKVLLKKGFAYETELGIYFDTSKAKDYTRLSGQKIEENKAGLGHGDVNDSGKKNSTDFALWIYKKGDHANALQAWSSPKKSFFSNKPKGFPGWHIECSAMIKDLLGDTIDLHLGGIEHIPVHHTNEIAQSENANGKEFVKYWMHYEHLVVDSKKMSKSEGTSYILDDLIKKGFSPLSLRLFFLQAHYRSQQNFTWEALEASETALRRLKTQVQTFPTEGSVSTEYVTKFDERLQDDFDTPGALAVVWSLLKEQNISDANKRATIVHFDKVLGLSLSQITETKENIEIPPAVTEIATKRKMARDKKDWKTADQLRDEILKLGYTIKDTEDNGFIIGEL